MKYHYLRALLFSQFKSASVEQLTGWKEAEIFDSKSAHSPTFEVAMAEHVSIRPGTANHALLTVYSALHCLSEPTLSGKANEILLLSNRRKWTEGDEKTFVEFPYTLNQVDYIRWLALDYWTVTEVVILSLGLRPERQVCDEMERINYRPEMESWLLKEFKLRRKLLVREADRGGLKPLSKGPEACDPLTSFEWLEQSGFPVTPQLFLALKEKRAPKELEEPKDTPTAEHIAENPVEITPNPSNANEDELNPKERTALLKLIHAFSQSRHIRYEVSKPRNGAIKRVHNLVLDAGLDISERTIKKYLRAAHEEAERLKDKNL
jgi:hypothetical protein